MLFVDNYYSSGVDFTKSRKSKINRKCDFQAFDWLKFTLTTDLRLTTFCEIDHWNMKCAVTMIEKKVILALIFYRSDNIITVPAFRKNLRNYQYYSMCRERDIMEWSRKTMERQMKVIRYH